MIKQNIKPLKLIDANLVLTVKNTYELSIQISLDGFSFCIYNSSNDFIEVLQHYPFKLKTPESLLAKIQSIFKEEVLLNHEFGKITVIHNNNLATLVPESLFDKSQLKTYLNLTVKTLENDYYNYDVIEAINAVNVYIPYTNINNYFIDSFGSFDYNHISGLLIKQFLTQNQKSDDPQMFVHINPSNFELIVIKDKKLLFFNTFNYKTKEDFIYYILFTAEQLNLDANTFELLLLGQISNTDALFSMAYKYVKNVSLYQYKLKQQVAFSISEYQKRQFFALLNQF